jgi:hypothetical protein
MSFRKPSKPLLEFENLGPRYRDKGSALPFPHGQGPNLQGLAAGIGGVVIIQSTDFQASPKAYGRSGNRGQTGANNVTANCDMS